MSPIQREGKTWVKVSKLALKVTLGNIQPPPKINISEKNCTKGKTTLDGSKNLKIIPKKNQNTQPNKDVINIVKKLDFNKKKKKNIKDVPHNKINQKNTKIKQRQNIKEILSDK